MLLFGGLRMETKRFEGALDREDDALIAWLGAAWKLNRHAISKPMYSGRTQDSSGAAAGPDLDQNVLSVGVASSRRGELRRNAIPGQTGPD